ncbi:hypothetical protein LTR10_001231 [Elasticomyces elasticus]|nr:hypothetical protein LTR10_001231 [Elasticomyces elasticus]KAK4965402.1 hypothetical protein LTR42_012158 [Elasticomyces elasticus]
MSSDNNSTLSAQVKKLNVSDDTVSETAPSELVAVVDDLLNQLSSKFGNLSSELIGKMDEMSRRLDNLEATIQAGNEQARAESET